MKISVIIITKDEQPRLKLALLALGRQTVAWHADAEIIIVDDGCAIPIGATDIPGFGPQPRIVRHESSRGRSAARNAGAALARGRRLLFLDGDVLMSPSAVELHGLLAEDALGRGEQRHLRGTRFFRDPRTGEPWPGKEQRVKSMGNLEPHLVTEEMVAAAPYERLLERSELAIYPGAAPRRLYELEMAALRAGSAPLAQWMAASGHNFSIPTRLFLDAGGFALDISINEHRELALRLCRAGARVVPVEGAISLHLTHREGYRDPLAGVDGWEQAFARRHPYETQLMMRFWRSLAGDATLDPGERIATLEHLDELLRQSTAAAARIMNAGTRRRVVRIFAKGNVDVRDSLLWSRVNGVVQWNGVNEILRRHHAGTVARIRHETCSRLDLIPLPGEQPQREPPAELARRLPYGSHPIDRQQRTALFDEPTDIVVFSLQSAVTNALVRHRRDGWLLLPDDIESWSAEPRAYLEAECEYAGLADLDVTMQRLEQLILAVEEKLGAQVLVYNLSSVTPGEQIHCWLGAEESIALRVQRFNLRLAELSAKLGFSIVDVDRLVASAGADRVKVDLFHLTAEGWRLVAEEVVRILEERGCLDGGTT